MSSALIIKHFITLPEYFNTLICCKKNAQHSTKHEKSENLLSLKTHTEAYNALATIVAHREYFRRYFVYPHK